MIATFSFNMTSKRFLPSSSAFPNFGKSLLILFFSGKSRSSYVISKNYVYFQQNYTNFFKPYFCWDCNEKIFMLFKAKKNHTFNSAYSTAPPCFTRSLELVFTKSSILYMLKGYSDLAKKATRLAV